MADYLLDTCAVIWIARGDLLREPAARELREAHGHRSGLVVSPITAWEIATLSSKAKLSLDVGPDIWFDRFCALPGVRLADMPPSVLVASTILPGVPPRDPADRILIATARVYGLTLVTRDRAILEYGAEGYVQVLAC